MKKFNTLLCAIFFATQIFSQTVSTFENLILGTDTIWNGSDLSGGFNSGLANFANSYNGGNWSGFSYSNVQDTATAGYLNQYAAITGSGYNGSTNYAVANEYGNAKIRLTANAAGKSVKGFYVTNATFAYLSMKSGDMFAKKFGGVTGTDPDWFRLTIKGWFNGTLKNQSVQFYLADFRAADSTQDYIVRDWRWVDLQTLGNVDSIMFQLESTDTAGGFGMNNPAYFALDNFTTLEQVPFQTIAGFEDLSLATDTFENGINLLGGFASGNGYFRNSYSGGLWSGFTYSNKTDDTTSGYLNQNAAVTAGGFNGSPNYAVANDYGDAKVVLTGNAASGKLVKGFYATNATYAYLSVRDGDMFGKKFGGVSGNDPDWFRLTVLGWYNGALKQQSVEFFLADFRSNNNADDYIVKDWRWVDLQSLGNVDSLEFHLSSSDTTGGLGMNTPAYWAMDYLITADTAYAQPTANDDAVTTTYLNDTVIAVLANDAGLIANPYTVELLSAPLIPGATATVENNEIHYTPAVGIVAADSLVYRVYDALGASDTAVVYINVTGITGLDEIADVAAKIYPNPFSSLVSIRLSALINQVQLFDVTGTLVKNISSVETNTIELNTEELASGIYFVKMNSVNGILVKKIVKQ